MGRKGKGAGSGMTLVDAWMIPDEDVATYRADRERLATRARELLEPVSASVQRCWQGSEDGEAVVGFDASGEILALVHLDPDGVVLLHTPGALEDYLRVDGSETRNRPR